MRLAESKNGAVHGDNAAIFVVFQSPKRYNLVTDGRHLGAIAVANNIGKRMDMRNGGDRSPYGSRLGTRLDVKHESASRLDRASM